MDDIWPKFSFIISSDKHLVYADSELEGGLGEAGGLHEHAGAVERFHQDGKDCQCRV